MQRHRDGRDGTVTLGENDPRETEVDGVLEEWFKDGWGFSVGGKAWGEKCKVCGENGGRHQFGFRVSWVSE